MSKKIKFTENNLPSHLRVSIQYLQPSKIVGMPANIKRITLATLVDRVSNQRVAQGMSVCDGRDNDNRKVGRAMAVGRAYKAYTTTTV